VTNPNRRLNNFLSSYSINAQITLTTRFGVPPEDWPLRHCDRLESTSDQANEGVHLANLDRFRFRHVMKIRGVLYGACTWFILQWQGAGRPSFEPGVFDCQLKRLRDCRRLGDGLDWAGLKSPTSTLVVQFGEMAVEG